MTARQLETMEYGEYVFRAGMLAKRQVQAAKEKLIAASFTAWQMISFQGGKIPWRRHLEAVGLLEPKRLTKKELAETTETVKRIAAKLTENRSRIRETNKKRWRLPLVETAKRILSQLRKI